MISNIIVLASIIFVAIVVAAYKSKRPEPLTKCGCGKSETGLCDNSHAESNTTGSIETVTNDTSS